MTLTEAQISRARGMVLGAAVGDALGAGYEFAELPDVFTPDMIGGGLGGFAPGEWTDDTSMTYIVIEAAAKFKSLEGTRALNSVARGFKRWASTNPPDIGGNTSRVLGTIGKEVTAARITDVALEVNAKSNGSLMRTAPVVLPYLNDPLALVEVAMDVSALTHASSHAMQACALWCLTLRHAVLTGELNVRNQIDLMPVMTRDYWKNAVLTAYKEQPYTFTKNENVVVALQAALSSVVHTKDHDFEESLYTAIRVGMDTDTVASVAGSLVGALHGVEAIPDQWLAILHGYPGKTGKDLDRLTVKALS